MRFRLASAGHLAECLAILHPADPAAAYDCRRLAELWLQLLDTDDASFAVVDDPLRPWPSSLEGFLASVFVTDAFVEECTTGRSSPSAALYERMLADRSPVLRSVDVRAANSTHGLNLLLLHLAVRTPEVLDRRTVRALRQVGAALSFFRAGYRLNVVFGEAFGRAQADFLTAAGLRPLDDAAGDPRRVRGSADRRLFLMRKEWDEPAALGQVSMLFHAPPARLGLTRAEQRIVLGALLGRTDREIASTGAVSTDAVKKTWRRLHERMALAIPHLDAAAAAHMPFAADRRSAEKRRRLIEYLRYHPEELRPVGGRAPGSRQHRQAS
jgi:hypothetical protein